MAFILSRPQCVKLSMWVQQLDKLGSCYVLSAAVIMRSMNSTRMTNAELEADSILNSYKNLTKELLSFYFESLADNWPRYNSIILYYVMG